MSLIHIFIEDVMQFLHESPLSFIISAEKVYWHPGTVLLDFHT